MLKISDHITYAEATKSQVAVRYNLKMFLIRSNSKI